MFVRVDVRIERRVPQRTAIGLVVQKPEGKDVWMVARGCVHGVGAFGGVYHWLFYGVS